MLLRIMASLNAVTGKKILFSLRVVQQRLAQPRPWVTSRSASLPLSTISPCSSNAAWSQMVFTTSSWCVINTMVRLRRWLISASRASTEAVVSGSSALVASSHSNTSGRAASARAMPTRCFAHRKAATGRRRPFAGSTSSSSSRTGLASGPRHSGNLQRHRDVVSDGAGMQQIEVLENHPGAQAIIPQRRLVQLGNILSVHRMRPEVGRSSK